MDREWELRCEMVEVGRRMVEQNLVQGTWGNISARLDEKRMLVTPSGLDYLRLMPEDMVIVDIETLESTGKHKPTSERKLHAAIFRERADVNAAMHTHSEYCCVMAAARAELPDFHDGMTRLGGNVRSAPYALPGTKKMTKTAVEALRDRNACYMANHGAVAVGESIEDAFETCFYLEEESMSYVLRENGLDQEYDEDEYGDYEE